MLGNPLPVALYGKVDAEFRQIVLNGRIVDVGIELSPLVGQ
jgi:hypothetical protein